MTMRAFGDDRLTVGEDGLLYLTCHQRKTGWAGRREADAVHRDFPGTCIRWSGELFEVISIESRPEEVRYVLAPWSGSHTIRTLLDYDDASEKRLESERIAESARQKRAAGFTLLAVVTGLLPAQTQLEQERELGISAWLTSLISIAIPFLAGGACLMFFMASALSGTQLGLPRWIYFIGIYFWVESLVRLAVVLGQSRPIGSAPVVLVWEIVEAIRGNRPLRRSEPRLKWELDPATLDRDAYIQREPFLALLSPVEQELLAERYGFDWSSRGMTSVWVLLCFAVFVAAFAFTDLVSGRGGAGDVVTLLIMAYLIREQVTRLGRIRGGSPAGSVLGVLVRPMARKIMK